MQPFSDRKSPGAEGSKDRYRNSNQVYSLQESERTKSMNMTTVSPRRNNKDNRNNVTGRDYEPVSMSMSAADSVRPTNVTAHSKTRFRTIDYQITSPATR